MHRGREMGDPAIKIESMSREDRLDLLERLWDSLSRVPADVPVTDAQRAELGRRSADLDDDAANGRVLGVPWDEVARQLRARR